MVSDKLKKELLSEENSPLLVREAGLEPARAYCTLEPESNPPSSI